MIDTIEKLLAADPEAQCVGGDVVAWRDGRHVSYGRTIAVTDGRGETRGVFQPTSEGEALLAEPRSRRKPKKGAADEGEFPLE